MTVTTKKYETREQWLNDAAEYLYTDFIGELGHMKKGETWAVSCGWPSTRSQSTKHRRIGECWRPQACDDNKTHHIFISPVVSDPVDVLATLLHELIHAVVGADCGHKGAFKRLAVAVGLEGKMTATVAGEELQKALTKLARTLGKYPHSKLTGANGRKKQTTRLIKVQCDDCGYTARVTRSWLEVGLLSCPDGEQLVEA
jgi:hypothetical protein